MKKIFMLFLVILAFSITGCGSSNSDNSDDSSSLYGIKNLRTALSPGSGYYNQDSITLKLSAEGTPDVAKYTTDGSDPKVNGTSFKDGDTFTINLGSTESIVKLYVKKGSNETTNSYNYKKSAPLAQVSDFNQIRTYQIMVESFMDGKDGGYTSGYGPSSHKGDIRGIINSLDYIKSLNVNAIWLTPIFASYSTDIKLRPTGYFADDYFNVDPNFGTNDDFRELVNEAHKRGLYVFLDGVFGHHGVSDIDGVKNLTSQGSGGFKTEYPASLDFYKEVATYWIKNYEIDGWRLDQAYQLYQGKHNYWQEIREAIETTCSERKTAGNQWGTLGYMVGEIWDWHDVIINTGYGNTNDIHNIGLLSCFDFPTRYSLVKVLSTQEDTAPSDATGQPASLLNDILNEISSKYPSYAKPNLFVTNHDTVRFGNLISRAPSLGYGPENNDYWLRHKAVFSFMTQYTGPITLYYGDEYGEYLQGYYKKGDLGYYDDHMSRSQGRIDGVNATLNSNELNLKNYVTGLMALRKNHMALSDGTRTSIIADDTIFANLKSYGNEKIVYVLNTSTNAKSISIPTSSVSGYSTLKSLQVVSSDSINTVTPNNGVFVINVPALTGLFYIAQ